jgi:hypothetical protein
MRNGAAVAQKVQTLFIDDIDGSAAALAAYIKAGRRVSGGTRRPARSGRKGPASGLNTTEVREWARTQGIEVKDRGRVPAELVVKFKAATSQ